MHLSFLDKGHSLTLYLVCIFIPAMFEYVELFVSAIYTAPLA